MQLQGKPLAFVDESGFVIPNPVFSTESLRHIRGRFIYTPSEFKQAVDDMNKKQDERRMLADSHYGADAVQIDPAFEEVTAVIDEMDGQRETVPSMTASPTRKRKTEGKSQKLTQPNYAALPDTLDMPQQGVDLTDEERADLRGIDTSAALTAMFGAK